jgi:hypothetical protein
MIFDKESSHNHEAVIMEKVKIKSKSRDAAAKRPNVPRINLDSIKAPTTTAGGSKMESSKRSAARKGMAFLESTNYNR